MTTVPFAAHAGLLEAFLRRHDAVVERIESRLLNVQGKDIARTGMRQRIDRMLEACFYELPDLPADALRSRGQLAAAHVADGFEPVTLEGDAHSLDPAAIVARAHRHWTDERWPGRNRRLAFARVVFGVFILRQLEALSLRIWDQGANGGAEGLEPLQRHPQSAAERLDHVQRLLDTLNEVTSPTVLVRDARWLIQTAQGPLTRHLAPYFAVAGQIAESFTPAVRLEVHKAGAKLAGGHLRSQALYRSAELKLPADDPAVLAVTRNSNSMDVALLVGDLVPLLEAYAAARVTGDDAQRLDLADAIFQGVSADPELLLTRLDLLGPCATIETLFVQATEATGGGGPRHTALGRTHAALLTRYRALIGETAGWLLADVAGFEPAIGGYSPLGLAYGFCADLLSHAVVSTLTTAPPADLGLEDMFVSRGNAAGPLSRTDAWRRLPSNTPGHQPLRHSIEAARDIYARTFAALGARAAHPASANASRAPDARLFVVPRGVAVDSLAGGWLPAGITPAQEHCLTSDVNQAFATEATAFPKSQILRDRNEARFLASAETDGKWFAVSKTVLTTVLGQGKDALIVDVPAAVIQGLMEVCPELIVSADGGDRGVRQ